MHRSAPQPHLSPATRIALLDVTVTVTSGCSADDSLAAIARNVADVMDAEAASVIMFDSDLRGLVFRTAVGPCSQTLVGERFDASHGIAGSVYRGGQCALVNDARANSEFFAGIDHKFAFDTRSLVCAPIEWRGRRVGVIEVLNKIEDSRFCSDDLQLLRIFANLAATALSEPDLIEDCAPNRFVLEADVWTLRFVAGDHVETGRYPRGAAKGLSYYHALVSRPNQDIPAIDLVRTASPCASVSRRFDAAIAKAIQIEPTCQEAIDRDAMREVYEQIRDIQCGIDRAQESGDQTEAQVLSNELEQLRQQLRSDLTLRSTARALGPRSPQRKARESVRIAMKRARTRIAKTMPRLARHIEQAVRLNGTSFQYCPSAVSDWEL